MKARRWRIWISALLCFGGTGSAIADAFTDKVISVYQRAASDLKVTAKDRDELHLQTPNGPLTLYLDNIRAACTARPPDCNAKLDSFVASSISIARREDKDQSIAAEKLFLVLRSAGFGKRADQRFPNDRKKQLIVRPFVAGIEILYVLDTPKAFRFINSGDLDNVGLGAERLHEIAVRNSSMLKALEYEPAPDLPGIFFMPAEDGLGTARVFNTALWDRIESTIGGPVVVSAPTRDWLLFVKKDNRPAIARLRGLVSRIVRGESYPVSPVIFHRVNGVWKVYAR